MSKIVSFFARTDVFFYSLLWLIFLLIAGTLAQKAIGLYAAQETFFSSFILWIGFIPTPGGYTVMGIIFLSLLSKLFLQPWAVKNTGTIIIHIGALMLFFGGFLTAMYSYEGNMVIAEGETVNYISDYHKLELAFIEITHEETETVTAFQSGWLYKNAQLNHENLPFKAVVDFVCFHCDVLNRTEPLSQKMQGITPYLELKQRPLEKENERNRAGILLQVEGLGVYTIFEDMTVPQYIDIQGKLYRVELRRKRTYLPFSVHLVDFVHEKYAATNMAKSYASNIILKANNLEWRSLIQMNEPVRYKGFTLYQASFIEDASGQTTVLAVVKNVGRLFPYIASIVMCIGLLIHLLQRLPNLFKRKE